MSSDAPSFLSERQLATRWQVSTRTLQRRRKAGAPPLWMKLGDRILYPMSAILSLEKELLGKGEDT